MLCVAGCHKHWNRHAWGYGGCQDVLKSQRLANIVFQLMTDIADWVIWHLYNLRVTQLCCTLIPCHFANWWITCWITSGGIISTKYYFLFVAKCSFHLLDKVAIFGFDFFHMEYQKSIIEYLKSRQKIMFVFFTCEKNEETLL